MAGKKIVFVSTYPPRECGIATFTKDLSDAVYRKFGANLKPNIIAMEENDSTLRVYDKKVLVTVNQESEESYLRAAKKINSMKSVEAVNIQHEFGIFGGDYGSNLLGFMDSLKKRIITTFHTVLREPDEDMLEVVKKIAGLSEKIVVMTNTAKEILETDYLIEPEKIAVIPHGVPNVEFDSGKERAKRKYGLSGKKVFLTFGLISRGKGLEFPIRAMPLVLKEHPDSVYAIVGETHPRVREHEGESYRLELKALAKSIGVEDRVKFLDRYSTISEILECLAMTDVYVAPSLDPKQVSSGTVSYAMAVGKAIIASNNIYNKEMLGSGRGIVLEKNTVNGFAFNMNLVLMDDALRKNFERNCFEFSRSMIWSNVSNKYCDVFTRVGYEQSDYLSRIPRISFRHFHRLTDNFGMIQFADYSTPVQESGYTLDDNARALIVASKAYTASGSSRMLRAADTFLGFVEKCQMSEGIFHNIVDSNREFADDVGSEDSFGRAVNSLGTVLKSGLPDSFKLRAKNVLDRAVSFEGEIVSPRAQAHALIGLSAVFSGDDNASKKFNHYYESLVSKFYHNNDGSWEWFEPYLTYANSVLPEALFEVQEFDETGRARQVAVDSLEFLTKTHFVDNVFVPVGQDGWYHKENEKAIYDQQPLEAGSMTIAYLKAFQKTGEENYLKNARRAFEWFFGRNTLKQVLYDDATGGCFDGLTPNGVNLNQGAESMLAYLNARLSIR